MLIKEIYKFFVAHRNAGKSNTEFLKKFQKELSQSEIGCSFNPEHWIFEEIKSKSKREKFILECTKFIVEELKIKDIRLSIRWSKVYEEKKINFDYYKKLFEYFLSQNVNIILNIGPIKTMRWPEEQVPKEVLNKLKNPPAHGAVIDLEDEIAKVSVKYLKELIVFLKKHFTKEQLNKISALQANNESFYSFGEFGWTMSEELEIQFIQTIKTAFPNKKIFLNTAARHNLNQLISLIQASQIPSQDFIVGYNYYYKVPGQAESFILKYFDNLFLSPRKTLSTSKFQKFCSENNIELQVSELQLEPWMHIQSPGNSVKEFRFTLIRAFQDMLNLNENKKSVIRVWGIEDLAAKYVRGNLSEENKLIIELVKLINS